MGTKRYRLKVATWTVVREVGAPSPRKLDSPEAVVELARDLLRDQDDDREHFWVVLLNTQNHYLLAHLVSTGTQSATLVHPREVLGPALREGAAAFLSGVDPPRHVSSLARTAPRRPFLREVAKQRASPGGSWYANWNDCRRDHEERSVSTSPFRTSRDGNLPERSGVGDGCGEE